MHAHEVAKLAFCLHVKDVLVGRQKIKGRIGAEEEHVHFAALNSHPGNGGIVGADTDVAYPALGLFFFDGLVRANA